MSLEGEVFFHFKSTLKDILYCCQLSSITDDNFARVIFLQTIRIKLFHFDFCDTVAGTLFCSTWDPSARCPVTTLCATHSQLGQMRWEQRRIGWQVKKFSCRGYWKRRKFNIYKTKRFFLMVVFFIIIITRRVFEENKLWLTYFLTGFSSLCAAWNRYYNGAINTAKEHIWNCLNSTNPFLRTAKHDKIKQKLPMILANSKVIYFVFHYQNFHDTESKKNSDKYNIEM